MITPESLLIRKTTWLVRQQYPFITPDDVMEFYNDLVQAEEDVSEATDTTPISISATDLADFICDVVSDV